MKRLTFTITFLLISFMLSAHPIKDLMDRVTPGASEHFVLSIKKEDSSFFRIEKSGDKIKITADSYVNQAVGYHWYLKYCVHIHLSWNNMKQDFPQQLPELKRTIEKTTDADLRYDFNYCTFSYTMPFWKWDRWQQEIDWMALHGINMPLSLTGTGTIWRNVLLKLGYSKEEVNQFVAGPAFQAWFLMNNLEGWGGPNPDSWYSDQVKLQKRILKRMRKLGMKPVLAGYAGMIPHDAKQKLNLNVANPGKWCGYQRPAFLQPTDQNFQRIAKLYYQESKRLFGKADYYAIDPFHEGGSTRGVDLKLSGEALMQAMKDANPNAVWVAQAWQANPRAEMIKYLERGDLVVLDLFAESRPQWGDEKSSWYRKEGFQQHDWIYCMLLNYGGNVGLHGKMQQVIDGYYKAKNHPNGKTLRGVGLSMEGSENNPVMYELLTELPWRSEQFSKDEWLKNYVIARYGKDNAALQEAWKILSNSIYNCPPYSTQQGTHESIFCARPSKNAYQSSSWSEMSDYYEPEDVIKAANLFYSQLNEFKGSNNYEYDLVDILRQAIAEKGRLMYNSMMNAFKAQEKDMFKLTSERFLSLILLQDKLLSSRKEFDVAHWIKQARSLGHTEEESDFYEWNARVQITTWGNRYAANNGGLRDYAQKEWSGLLKDFYYMRWSLFIANLSKELNGESVPKIDWYAVEEPWTLKNRTYSTVKRYNSSSFLDDDIARMFN